MTLGYIFLIVLLLNGAVNFLLKESYNLHLPQK